MAICGLVYCNGAFQSTPPARGGDAILEILTLL